MWRVVQVGNLTPQLTLFSACLSKPPSPPRPTLLLHQPLHLRHGDQDCTRPYALLFRFHFASCCGCLHLAVTFSFFLPLHFTSCPRHSWTANAQPITLRMPFAFSPGILSSLFVTLSCIGHNIMAFCFVFASSPLSPSAVLHTNMLPLHKPFPF